MTAYALFSEEWWADPVSNGSTRCKAIRYQAGQRCRRAAIKGSLVCKHHGGAAPQVQRKARERVLLAADDAISQIIRLMEDQSVPAPVRLAAARDLADRADLGATSKVDVTVSKWENVAGHILVDLPQSVGPAEVVDEAYALADPTQVAALDFELPEQPPPYEPEPTQAPVTGSRLPRHIKDRLGLRR
ncbi:MAG: hypothetical protein JWM76_904 [Pseudonocardiales bacterium]|nr:hypothetical protein [Pseudonocardiales bacterium]